MENSNSKSSQEDEGTNHVAGYTYHSV